VDILRSRSFVRFSLPSTRLGVVATLYRGQLLGADVDKQRSETDYFDKDDDGGQGTGEGEDE